MKKFSKRNSTTNARQHTWIKGAQENNLVVGSQARILYADAEGRMKIAETFNQAIKMEKLGL